MPTATNEKKLADFLAKSLNVLNLDHNFVVQHMSRYNAAIHANLFELILAFLSRYAFRYTTGEVEPGDKAYPFCEMSARMLDALTVTQSNGRHCSDDD